MKISQFFIVRPIFAWVVAIIMMMIGIGAILRLPIAQYPDVAPPTIIVSAMYPGASAQTLETSVTQVIEQQLIGLDGLLYFYSTSDSSGQVSVNISFEKGTDPNIAQVQVQNKVQQGLSRLPSEVQQQGLQITKASNDILLVIGLYDETNRRSADEVADYLVSRMQDDISRVNGVGMVRPMGSEYGMRIWLDPVKLAARQLMPSDIENAVRAQNVDLSAGQLGDIPAVKGQMLNAVVKAKSRFRTPEEFRNVVVKTLSDGSVVRLSDVARVALGLENYTIDARLNGHPGSGLVVQQEPGADALKTAAAVKARVNELMKSAPEGYKVAYPRDTTTFVELSVKEVIETLIIAIVLVIAVMYLFLQSWRATLIPAIAVPVVLLGTFGILALFGYSINTLTLFGMVLAIGLLVDDAIVVVENVERIMNEEGLEPRAATIKSMDEIGSALIGIALVLSAVMAPMAFFGGSVGVIYRQFSITIISAMLLSVVVALFLSPALCATLLRPAMHTASVTGGLFSGFNHAFTRMTHGYVNLTDGVIRKSTRHILIYLGIVTAIVFLFMRLPTGFLPTEDQGTMMVQYNLPAGATAERADKIRSEIETYLLSSEKANIAELLMVRGWNFSGRGQNAGMAFANLSPFENRQGSENAAAAITGRATKGFARLRDAQAVALTPAPIPGLGQSNGFTFELLNSSNMDRTQFAGLRDKLVAAARQSPLLAQVRYNSLPDTPQLRVNFDDAKLAVLGLNETDATNVLGSAWGSTYIGDFTYEGRVKRVYMQSDAPYRMQPDDLKNWFVRAQTADAGTVMVPFSSFTTTRWETGVNSVSRFNGHPSYEINGEAASGYSSGQAMQEMVRLQQQLAPGTSYAWSGLSYQENESSGQALWLYIQSIIVVFLCLAALYESWTVPLAVILVIPLGIIGAVLAVTFRGLENNIYFQVGLLTTIGLASKNAILIVEFAASARRNGHGIIESAIGAARVRLRPILMTSIAFIAGVFPLAIATGAGAQSRVAIGTAVSGGMVTATVLAIFYVPMFFVLVSRYLSRPPKSSKQAM